MSCNENEFKQSILMSMEEEKSLRSKIETLYKDNVRKAMVILALYNVILKTGNINLIAEASIAMKDNG